MATFRMRALGVLALGVLGCAIPSVPESAASAAEEKRPAETKADDKKPTKELKVFARHLPGFTPAGVPKGAPMPPSKGPLPAGVIRTAEELVVACGMKDKAADKAAQNQVMAAVAKSLKVDGIDWKTQMLVIIDEGQGINRSLTVGPIKANDQSASVTYNIDTRQGGAAMRTSCRALLLVERFEGEVKFTRTYSRSGNPLAP